jgi:hypothetical protein
MSTGVTEDLVDTGSRHWETADTPSVAPRCHRRGLVAYLRANHPQEGNHRESWYFYDVIFDGRVIVADSKDPECDLARALLAEGVTGTIEMHDAVTGKPRTIINIDKAAKTTVEENRTRGPRFIRWRPNPFPAERLSRAREAA